MDSPQSRSAFVPVVLAWLVPGTGHLKIGRLWPGIFTFAAVLPMFVGGMALAGFENVSPQRHPFWFYGAHVWGGAITGAAAAATRDVERTEPTGDKSVGELFTGVACLLNLIAVADVWARCRRGDPEDRAARAAAAAATADPMDQSTPPAPSSPPTGDAGETTQDVFTDPVLPPNEPNDGP